MNINREEYVIRPLVREDGLLLKNWGRFNNPLFYGYEYNDLTKKEIDIWYRVKQKFYRAEYYSVISKDEKLIGYVGLKEINIRLNIAKLGIVLDPNEVSKGYGTKIMQDFLEYCFKEKKLRRLDLEVNAWNIRAIKLYNKLGFKTKKSKFIRFENQNININEEQFEKVRDCFKIKNAVLYTKIYIMNLERREYLNENRNRK